jgi:hypothetical protein
VKQTRALPLVVLGGLGVVVGWFAELMLVGSGRPSLDLPITLGVALGLIGVLVVLAALPVFRVVRRVAGASVDPFYATRIVLLAKASSLTGAILSGFTGAVLVYLLSRPAIAADGKVGMAVVALVGAGLLLAGGLVAERMCVLPPSDDDTPGLDKIAL